MTVQRPRIGARSTQARRQGGTRPRVGALLALSLAAFAGATPALPAPKPALAQSGPRHVQAAVDRTVALGLSGDSAASSWDWEAGIAQAGLMTLQQATGDAAILSDVRAWLDRALGAGVQITHPNHCTPAWPALLAYERGGKAEYLQVALRCAAYLRDWAPRVHGALAHHQDQLWDDTLIVAVPLLARLGSHHGCQDCLRMAADEYLAHARRLQDPATGRWFHGWDASDQRMGLWPRLSGAHWARGNGWTALAATELLAALPPSDPRAAAIRGRLNRQLQGLAALQDRSGLWHTVTTRADFYLESSGSAAIATAMLRATDAGWVDPNLRGVGLQAARAVDALVADDGTLTQVSAGTGVAPSIEVYNLVPRDQIKPYGQGLYLMMAAAWR